MLNTLQLFSFLHQLSISINIDCKFFSIAHKYSLLLSKNCIREHAQNPDAFDNFKKIKLLCHSLSCELVLLISLHSFVSFTQTLAATTAAAATKKPEQLHQNILFKVVDERLLIFNTQPKISCVAGFVTIVLAFMLCIQFPNQSTFKLECWVPAKHQRQCSKDNRSHTAHEPKHNIKSHNFIPQGSHLRVLLIKQ